MTFVIKKEIFLYVDISTITLTIWAGKMVIIKKGRFVLYLRGNAQINLGIK